jgi:hypothetical protein
MDGIRLRIVSGLLLAVMVAGCSSSPPSPKPLSDDEIKKQEEDLKKTRAKEKGGDSMPP